MDVIEPAPLTGLAMPQLDPESALVGAAVALLGRHTADETERTCRACGQPYPCDSGRHAVVVCRAAGLDLASVGLPAEASRWELVG
jgi:hypothetical protein